MTQCLSRPQAPEGTGSNQYLDAIREALTRESSGTEFRYEERDVILYNLGIGAKRTDLRYVFESADDFQPIPTFGVIPPFNAEMPFDFTELVPNFSPAMLLHGEQFLEIASYPIPASGKLISKCRLLEVVDKGPSAAIARYAVTTADANTGKPVFYNESSVFLRGCGGFGGPKKGADRGAATAANKPPSRGPDVVVEEATSPEQAAIYRLSGDWNPLHIDPGFAKAGGFKVPILHGLCTFGFAGKAVYEK